MATIILAIRVFSRQKQRLIAAWGRKDFPYPPIQASNFGKNGGSGCCSASWHVAGGGISAGFQLQDLPDEVIQEIQAAAARLRAAALVGTRRGGSEQRLIS